LPLSSRIPLHVDLNIFRDGPGSGWAEKISVISGRKNPAHDHPTGRIGPQFLGWTRGGPELGRAARAFYSVKQLKTAFRARLGPKKFFAGFKIFAHAHLVRFMGGPGAGRACRPGRVGLKMLRYSCTPFSFKNSLEHFTVTDAGSLIRGARITRFKLYDL
jgi:hypothetical protein